MALGFSGSNGGVSSIYQKVDEKHIGWFDSKRLPLEVSYFVNNACNLNCRHCYVGYKDTRHVNSFETWKTVFSDLIDMGARTFGNVGKEPLLNWDLTRDLLAFLQERQRTIPELRYGLVTNGLLFSDEIIAEMVKLKPTYIDISLDGNRDSHDSIRGEGAYDKLMANLKKLAETELVNKVFISFTLNRINQADIEDVVATIYDLGIKNLLLSPYVTLDKEDALYLSDYEMADILSGIIRGEAMDFNDYDGLIIYVKSDYSTSKGLVKEMIHRGLNDPTALFVDEYGVMFNRFEKGRNEIILNYLPYDNTFSQAIRISHDGYVSGCLDMFYGDYKLRAAGNVNQKPIRQILQSALSARDIQKQATRLVS